MLPGARLARLVVTTCRQPEPLHLERARALATRLGAGDVVERRSYAAMFASSPAATHLYVVGREHDEVRDRDGASCFVQEGLLATKLVSGRAHPFMRALAPPGEPAPQSILDGTLGLANDAVHAATVLDCLVVGVEGSLVLHALLEEGVPRLARTRPAAQHIDLHFGDTVDFLAGCDDDAFDVVSLDPMMSKARRSAPPFALVRTFAVADRASPELLSEAVRVARRRVVLKLGKGAPIATTTFARRELGAHVVYWCHDKQPGRSAS